jgi:hypothetical protein
MLPAGPWGKPSPILTTHLQSIDMPAPVPGLRTLYDKIWDDHVVYVSIWRSDHHCMLIIDLLLQGRQGGQISPHIYRSVSVETIAVIIVDLIGDLAISSMKSQALRHSKDCKSALITISDHYH